MMKPESRRQEEVAFKYWGQSEPRDWRGCQKRSLDLLALSEGFEKKVGSFNKLQGIKAIWENKL
jgi:hypothetical protein